MRRLVGKEIPIYVAVDLKRATRLIMGDYLIVGCTCRLLFGNWRFTIFLIMILANYLHIVFLWFGAFYLFWYFFYIFIMIVR